MKIAISASGSCVASTVDTRFGRAPGFLIYETDTRAIEYRINTQNLNAAQGAGIQSAGNVIESGAKAVITGHCGPKAFAVLHHAGIPVYTVTGGSVADALAALAENRLVAIASADVEGHWA